MGAGIYYIRSAAIYEGETRLEEGWGGKGCDEGVGDGGLTCGGWVCWECWM